MNWAERVLSGFAVVLLAAVVAGADYAVGARSESFTGGHIPATVVFGQVVSLLAPSFSVAGLGILAGLLFARGLRWRPRAEAEAEAEAAADAHVGAADRATYAGDRPE